MLTKINRPLFSIIIPTMNSEMTLQRCLNSIEGQSFKDFQVIFVDGISSDDTLLIEKKFCAENLCSILISEKDRGIYDAMNKGIKLATGEWIYFLGSDDTLFDENILEKIAQELRLTSSEVIYGNVLMKGESKWNLDGIVFNGAYDLPRILNENICHQAIFYRKSVFDRLGDYKLEYSVGSDYDFNLRCFANTKVSYIETIVANFSLGGYSSLNEDEIFHRDRGAILFNYFQKKIFGTAFIGSRLYLKQAALQTASPLSIIQRTICMTAYLKLKCQDTCLRIFKSLKTLSTNSSALHHAD